MKKSHVVLTILGCLLPLAGIAAILLFRLPASTVLYVGLALLCPLLHLAMMRNMDHGHAHTPNTAPRPRPMIEAPQSREPAVHPGPQP